MYQVATIQELDNLINQKPMYFSEDMMSPEMRQAYDAFSAATRLFNQQHFSDAIRRYQQVLAHWPSFVAPRVMLANAHGHLGRFDEAQRQLRIAHGHGPRDPDIHRSAAYFYEVMGQHGLELQEYLEAYKDVATADGELIASGKMDLTRAIGITYRQLGDLDQAVEWLNRSLKAVDLQEGFGEFFGTKHTNERFQALVELGQTYLEQGQWAKAVETFRQCLSMNPPAEPAEFLKRQLQIAETRMKKEGRAAPRPTSLPGTTTFVRGDIVRVTFWFDSDQHKAGESHIYYVYQDQTAPDEIDVIGSREITNMFLDDSARSIEKLGHDPKFEYSGEYVTNALRSLDVSKLSSSTSTAPKRTPSTTFLTPDGAALAASTGWDRAWLVLPRTRRP